MTEAANRLHIEKEHARRLLEAIALDIGSDEVAAHDMVLAETGLMEAIDAALLRRAELICLQCAIGDQIKRLKARQQRFEVQCERVESALAEAMRTIGQRKIERATATLYFAKQQDRLEIAPDAVLSAGFLRMPEPDRVAIRTALAVGETIPGVRLVPQPHALRVRST